MIIIAYLNDKEKSSFDNDSLRILIMNIAEYYSQNDELFTGLSSIVCVYKDYREKELSKKIVELVSDKIDEAIYKQNENFIDYSQEAKEHYSDYKSNLI